MEGLYVAVPSDSKPKLPPSTSPPDVKTKALFSLVSSLSVMVTVVARLALPAVEDQLSTPLPSVTSTCPFVPSADGKVIEVEPNPIASVYATPSI